MQSPESAPGELGGENRGSWKTPQGVQEMNASTGGLNTRPVGVPRVGGRERGRSGFDMSGAPMSEEYQSHELE